MGGRTIFEARLVNALEAIRDQAQLDSAAMGGGFQETILLNGTGGAAAYEDFGAGWTETIVSPAGYKGKVLNVQIFGVTETFTDDTTEARVDVGSAADGDAYYVGGDIGTASSSAPANPAGTFVDFIPAGSNFVVTGVAPTGGTPAGRSRVALTIAWIKE